MGKQRIRWCLKKPMLVDADLILSLRIQRNVTTKRYSARMDLIHIIL